MVKKKITTEDTVDNAIDTTLTDGTVEPKKEIQKTVKKEKKSKLSLKQERFCRLFASDKEFFGNGVQSYMKAWDLEFTKKNYNVAKASAFKLLTYVYITDRINELFEARGLNDVFVDKQLEKLLTQDADFRTKVQAIKEYNNLKARITQKHELINPVNVTITRGSNPEGNGHISGTDNTVAQESPK